MDVKCNNEGCNNFNKHQANKCCLTNYAGSCKGYLEFNDKSCMNCDYGSNYRNEVIHCGKQNCMQGSHWKPKEKEMNKIQFESDSHARGFLDDIIETQNDDHVELINRSIVNMIKYDYIKKSDLEIARDAYQTWVSCARGFYSEDSGEVIIIEQLWSAITEIEKALEAERGK